MKIHNYLNKCVCKNTTYTGVWSPTNCTTWVVEHVELPIGKTNTPLRKEFPIPPIKKIATLVLPSTFANMLSLHAYHQLQKHCAYPNYDAIPNTLEIGKLSLSLILGRLVWIVRAPIASTSNNTMAKWSTWIGQKKPLLVASPRCFRALSLSLHSSLAFYNGRWRGANVPILFTI